MKKYIFMFIMVFSLMQVYAQDLTVLTYNIKYDNPNDSLNNWDNRKDFLINQLQYNAPDVFGTQEGLIHQLNDIQAGLNGYKFVGVGRDSGDDEGEFSAIFYNDEVVELQEENTFWLSTTPNIPSKGWDAAIKRICTYAKFKLRDSGKEFYVFNTHFDHIGKQARLESARLILNKINKINKEKLPMLLMGDFNLEPDTKGIKMIAEKLDDSYTLAGKKAFGPAGTYNGFHFEKPVTRRIDYIFSSQEGLKLLKQATLSDNKNLRYPSDHFPVVAKYSFK